MTRRVYEGDSRALLDALSTLMAVLEARGERQEFAALMAEFAGLAERLGVPGAAKAEPGKPPVDVIDRIWQLIEIYPELVLQKAEKKAEETDRKIVGPMQILAEAYYANKRPEDAKKAMERAIELWQELGQPTREKYGRRHLEWMRQRLKDYDKER